MNTMQFDKKCVCGPEFVCVKILENCDELKVGSIYLPSNSEANNRLAFCQVQDVGWKAAETHGLKAGDYVMIDRLATFAHTAPIALLKYDSVIMLTNESKSDFWPLRNMVFVEPEKKDSIAKVDNIYVPGYRDKLNLGTITKMNCDADLKLPFEVGDTVLMTKGADNVKLGDIELHIYKHDMIICKIEKQP